MEAHLSSRIPRSFEYEARAMASSRTPRAFERDARAAARLHDEPGSYHGYPATGPPTSASRQPRRREGYQDYGSGSYDQIYGHGSNGQSSGHGFQGQDYGYVNDDEGYGHGSHERHGQHYEGSHQHHGGTSHRQGKRPAHEPSTSQHARHHHSSRSGGHRGHADDEQVLQDQMLAMSLQQQEDQYSSAFVSGEPSQRYLEGPHSQALIGYEYGEQSTSALVPYDGRRHRGHEGVSDPHLAHYETISPNPRDHHGGGSKSSSTKIGACGVCMEEFPVAELYKLCPQSKCPFYCADCTKGKFPSLSHASFTQVLTVCNRIFQVRHEINAQNACHVLQGECVHRSRRTAIPPSHRGGV